MPKETSARAEPPAYAQSSYACSPAIAGLARLLVLYEIDPEAVTLDDINDALEAALDHAPGQDMNEALLVQARVLDLAFYHLIAESTKNSNDEQTDMNGPLYSKRTIKAGAGA